MTSAHAQCPIFDDDDDSDEFEDVVAIGVVTQQQQADAQLALSLQQAEREADEREQNLADQEAIERAHGGGSSSDAVADASPVKSSKSAKLSAPVDSSSDESEDDDESEDESNKSVKRYKKDVPQLKEPPMKWANDRDLQGGFQLAFFKYGVPMGFTTTDMANFAKLILDGMYGVVSARYTWAREGQFGSWSHEYRTNVSSTFYYAGWYESFAGPTLWVCLSIQIALFVSRISEGFEVGSKKAAKKWQLAQLHHLLRKYAKGKGFTTHEVAEGADDDVGHTVVGSQKAGKRGGVSALGRKLHDQSSNDHKRRFRVDKLCKGEKLKRQIKCFEHVYNDMRRVLRDDAFYANLPDIPQAILNQQRPSVFRPLGAAHQHAESDSESSDVEAYEAKMKEGREKLAEQKKASGMLGNRKSKMPMATADAQKDTKVIQKRDSLASRKAAAAKEAKLAEREERREREANEAFLASDDEDQAAEMERLNFRKFGVLSDENEHVFILSVVQVARRHRARRVAADVAARETVDWLIEQTIVNSITEGITAKYDAVEAEARERLSVWDTNRRHVNATCAKVDDDDDDDWDMLDMAKFAELPEQQRTLYNSCRPGFDETSHALHLRAEIARSLPQKKAKPARPNPKKVKIDCIKRHEPGHFRDYATAFGFASEAEARAHLADMQARRKLVHPDGREETRGIGNADNKWLRWEARFYALTDMTSYRSARCRLDADQRKWREALRAAEAAAVPKKHYEANPHWDNRNKCWKDGQADAGMARAGDNQTERAQVAEQAEQIADRKRRRAEHTAGEAATKRQRAANRSASGAANRKKKADKSAAYNERVGASRKRRGVSKQTTTLRVNGVVITSTKVMRTTESIAERQLREQQKAAQKLVSAFQTDLVKACLPGPPKSGERVALMEPILNEDGTLKSQREYKVWKKKAIDTWTGRNLSRKPYREGTTFKFKVSGLSSALTDWERNPAPGVADYEQTVYHLHPQTGERWLSENGLPMVKDYIVHPAHSAEAAAARMADGVESEGESEFDDESELGESSELGDEAADASSGDDDDLGDLDLFGDDDDDGDLFGETTATTDVPSSAFSSMAGAAEDEKDHEFE